MESYDVCAESVWLLLNDWMFMKKRLSAVPRHGPVGPWVIVSLAVHLVMIWGGGVDLNEGISIDSHSGLNIVLVESTLLPESGVPPVALQKVTASGKSMVSATQRLSAPLPHPETIRVNIECADSVSSADEGILIEVPLTSFGETAGVDGPTGDVEFAQAMPFGVGNRRPEYPRLARQRGWEGEVLLWVKVDYLGEIVGCDVERSSGYLVLDEAALKAVRQWRFSPALQNGLPVESIVHVPVAFKLDRI